MTTFGDGVFQYGGSPVGAVLGTSKIFSTPYKGRAWFVDATKSTSGTGRTPKGAFTTMAQAFNVVQSGDIIYFVGKIREQLVTPVQVFDVTIVGCGNRPRHADAAPVGGDVGTATWAAPASPTAGQALVRVLQQGWRFINILFAGSAGCASIELVRNAASGNDERDASHAEILNCRFAGVASTDTGIKFGATSYTEIVNNTLIEGNEFQGCATAIGLHSANLCYRARIKGNSFQSNTNHIVGGLYNCFVIGNDFGAWTTTSINLTGGTGSNLVTRNYLWGDYSTASNHYVSASGDEWSGNFTSDEAETEVSGSLTIAVPAS
jgi:hypothetical protein